MYRVLWIDDQPEKMPDVIIEAKELYAVELINCRSKAVGIRELEKPKPQYDAVVLDAFMINELVSEEPTKKHLFAILNRLHELKGMNIHIPYLVFSANAGSLLNDQTFMDWADDIPVFQKSNDETPKMFAKLIEMIKNRPETELRNTYESVLDLCTDRYIGHQYEVDLLKLLKVIDSKTAILGIDETKGCIRYILEGIVDRFGVIGVLPKVETKEEDSLNWGCNILMGKAKSYASKNEILAPLISHILENTLKIAQDIQHKKRGLELNVNKYIENHGSRYFINAAIFNLLEIMLFCKKYFDANRDEEKSRGLVQKNIGNVLVDKFGNYFCQNFSGTYLISSPNRETNLGDKILIHFWKINRDKKIKYKRVITKYETLTS